MINRWHLFVNSMQSFPFPPDHLSGGYFWHHLKRPRQKKAADECIESTLRPLVSWQNLLNRHFPGSVDPLSAAWRHFSCLVNSSLLPTFAAFRWWDVVTTSLKEVNPFNLRHWDLATQPTLCTVSRGKQTVKSCRPPSDVSPETGFVYPFHIHPPRHINFPLSSL